MAMHSATDPQPDLQWLQEHAGRAFVEVQRADTKATALCGVAGGLLALSVAGFSGTGGASRVAVFFVGLVCLLLACAVGAALLALRPAVPANGLRAELMSGADRRDCDVSSAGGEVTAMALERRLEAHRLEVLARLADRKLRSVRLAVDFILAAHLVAGMGLLSSYTFN
ncbi:hypothetical protein ACFU76_23085 [Streptomyces sp. NPDC057539]|uniref:hypothetical protein n=1 Tax=Streptomyces sp. NPDC057539 TaxID=3346159 RepID=UPI0036A37BB1